MKVKTTTTDTQQTTVMRMSREEYYYFVNALLPAGLSISPDLLTKGLRQGGQALALSIDQPGQPARPNKLSGFKLQIYIEG